MAYVRRYGNQLTLVQGSRDKETGKVEQEILFTIYSKGEALDLLGRGTKGGDLEFESLMQDGFPQIPFNWKAIRKAVDKNLSHLPDLYKYREERLGGRFQKDLSAFARQLIVANAQERYSAAQLIQDHRYVLEFLTELLQWRLKTADQKKSEWNGDNAFYWRAEFRGREVPQDVEELVENCYQRGELAKAKAVFRFLTEVFGQYAEGHCYLGLIALDEDNLEEAALAFTRTMDVGQRLFPKRIAKSKYWNDLSTRPYIRGLRNLVLVVNRQGQFDEALALCDQLEKQCGDDLSAYYYRAFIYLNLGRWKLAADSAHYGQKIFQGDSFLAAFAHFELGDTDQARTMFLHGLLNNPRAARMLTENKVRGSPGRPKGHEEIENHNTGVAHLLNAHEFLENQSKRSKAFFRNLADHPRVHKLLEKRERLTHENNHQKNPAWKQAFDELSQIRKMDFARQQSLEMSV